MTASTPTTTPCPDGAAGRSSGTYEGMAHRRRRSRRNPSPASKASALSAVSTVAGIAAPVVSKFVLDGPAVPVAGAVAVAGLVLQRTSQSPSATIAGHGLMRGGLIGLALSVLYNLRGASAQLVSSKNPDSMRGVG